MSLIFQGSITGPAVYSDSYSNNQVALASANENGNQTQVKNKPAGNQQIQSNANGGMSGSLQSLNKANAAVALDTPTYNPNIAPTRVGNVTGSAGIQNTIAGQVSAQGNGVNTQGQLANGQMVAAPNVNVTTPASPFEFSSSGSFAAQGNNKAQQLLKQIFAKFKKGSTQAQLKVSVAPQTQVFNSYGLEQVGYSAPTPNPTSFGVTSAAESNQGIQFNTAGNTSAQIQSNRPGSLQTGNSLALGTQAGVGNSSYSLIAIA